MDMKIIKFCMVGGSGVVVNMSAMWFLTDIMGVYYMFAGLLSIELAIISNFILNDAWTWHGIGTRGFTPKLNRLKSFNVVCAVGMIINLAVLWLLTTMAGMHYLISNLAGISAAVMWNFTVNDNVTWKVD